MKQLICYMHTAYKVYFGRHVKILRFSIHVVRDMVRICFTQVFCCKQKLAKWRFLTTSLITPTVILSIAKESIGLQVISAIGNNFSCDKPCNRPVHFVLNCFKKGDAGSALSKPPVRRVTYAAIINNIFITFFIKTVARQLCWQNA